MPTSWGCAAPPSDAAAKDRIAKWCTNDKDDLGFAIETLDDRPTLIGNVRLFGARNGTDAMRIIVDHGFQEMGLHRIQLDV